MEDVEAGSVALHPVRVIDKPEQDAVDGEIWRDASDRSEHLFRLDWRLEFAD